MENNLIAFMEMLKNIEGNEKKTNLLYIYKRISVYTTFGVCFSGESWLRRTLM